MAKSSSISQAETEDLWLPALRELGVMPGGAMLFHASLAPLSRAGLSAERVLETFISFLDGGTLAVPTLSWREVSPQQPNFDELSTRSNVGILSEVFRLRFAERRSLHPTHSVASAGPLTAALLGSQQYDSRPCAEDSPWGRLAGVGAQILLIGVDMDTCTLVHNLEETFAPERYLRDEIENYSCAGRNGETVQVATRRHRKLFRNFWKFREKLSQLGQLRTVDVLGTRVYGFAASDLVACGSVMFEKNKDASLALPGERSKLM